VTSALSSTTSCHCRLTSLRSVEQSKWLLHQLRLAVRSLSEDVSKTLVQAFLSYHRTTVTLCSSASRKDWYVNRLQSVQNAAARLVTGIGYWRSDHITPVHHQLHWFVVHQLVDFKVATLVHRSLSGISPSYLADDCSCLVADARERRVAYVPQRAESAL